MIAIFGRPGSGKGTQAERLAKHFGLQEVTSSKVISSQANEDQKWKVDHGVLLSREEMRRMFKQHIAAMKHDQKHPENSIFDGFPRTVEQAEDLWEILQAEEIPLEAIILLDISRAVAVRRMESRLTKEQRADDADAEARERRLNTYDELTEPAIRRLEKLSGLHVLVIHGEQQEDDVTLEIMDKLRGAGVRVHQFEDAD